MESHGKKIKVLLYLNFLAKKLFSLVIAETLACFKIWTKEMQSKKARVYQSSFHMLKSVTTMFIMIRKIKKKVERFSSLFDHFTSTTVAF